VSGAAPPAAGVPAMAHLVLRPLLREERQLALLWGVLAASSLLLRPFWLALAPLMPACPFRALTGVPCLSCGTTRAAVAFLDGRVFDALLVNPLAALAGLGFVAGGVIAPVWALLGLRVPRLPSVATPAPRIALALALLAGWAWVILVKQ
jgi:hypothetical protein